MSLTDAQIVTLTTRAQHGDRAAFDVLYAAHERKVYGFIRPRTSQDDDAQQVAQSTWLKVWEKISTYDPTLGSLRTFAVYWASLMLLRHYAEKKRRNKLEVLFSEIQGRYPDREHVTDIGDVLAHVAASKHPSVEDDKIQHQEDEAWDVEVHDELLRITFSGCCPPHQVITFAFCRLLRRDALFTVSKESAQDAAWTPQKVVAELSSIPLKQLAECLVQEYLQTSRLPAMRVRGHFAWLLQSMHGPLRDVVQEPRTRQTYTALLDCVVGGTILQQYYTHTHNPTSDISRWLSSVQRRVWSEVRQHGSERLLALLQAAERQT